METINFLENCLLAFSQFLTHLIHHLFKIVISLPNARIWKGLLQDLRIGRDLRGPPAESSLHSRRSVITEARCP